MSGGAKSSVPRTFLVWWSQQSLVRRCQCSLAWRSEVQGSLLSNLKQSQCSLTQWTQVWLSLRPRLVVPEVLPLSLVLPLIATAFLGVHTLPQLPRGAAPESSEPGGPSLTPQSFPSPGGPFLTPQSLTLWPVGPSLTPLTARLL